MNLARESIELLGQIARIFLFEGVKHGLRDREWMALRFLASANRFSRTPVVARQLCRHNAGDRVIHH